MATSSSLEQSQPKHDFFLNFFSKMGFYSCILNVDVDLTLLSTKTATIVYTCGLD